MSWYPDHDTVQVFTPGWSENFDNWGIPYTTSNGECVVTRRQDARALDAVIRLDPHGYDGSGLGERAERAHKQNTAARRAAFERARRDLEFLEALEAVTLARVSGGLTDEAVRAFFKTHLPDNYALTWRHAIAEEEATKTLTEAVFRYFKNPSTENKHQMQVAAIAVENKQRERWSNLHREDA